ncbi:hypothetical protein V1478_000035 [Vespula squamosa]|uniref:Maturase K n=1 Tax=Vespula squamosa TaxID=30214 RepID=A0ABD2C947_VESSQ
MYTRNFNCFSYRCDQLSQLKEEIVDNYHCSRSEGRNKLRENWRCHLFVSFDIVKFFPYIHYLWQLSPQSDREGRILQNFLIFGHLEYGPILRYFANQSPRIL